MGLLGLLFGNSGSNSTWTKSDWDREIMRLNNELADAKIRLQMKRREVKGNPMADYWISFPLREVEELKAKIANAKIKRKNAPK